MLVLFSNANDELFPVLPRLDTNVGIPPSKLLIPARPVNRTHRSVPGSAGN